MGDDKERDTKIEEWLRLIIETWGRFTKISKLSTGKNVLLEDEEEEERNDVFIYKTLRYPPKSTPPTIN